MMGIYNIGWVFQCIYIYTLLVYTLQNPSTHLLAFNLFEAGVFGEISSRTVKSIGQIWYGKQTDLISIYIYIHIIYFMWVYNNIYLGLNYIIHFNDQMKMLVG